MRVGKLVPESLASSTVLDREGRQILLESFWAEGPAVLVFMRHFGCLCLSAQITELSPRLFELHQLGIRTVFIGNGAADFIDGFIERFGLADKKIEIVTDPPLEAFFVNGDLCS